jgi:hypothetical protein
MKTIIQRNLDLSKVYTLEGISYVSLVDGGGTCCDNCGKPISNIAELKSEEKHYYVGLDCMDTILEQSQNVMSWDDQYKYNWIYKAAIQKAKSTRAKILKLKKQYGDNLIVTMVEFKDKFGFSYDKKDERWGTSPLGFDYRYENEFKEITTSYTKDLVDIRRTVNNN